MSRKMDKSKVVVVLEDDQQIRELLAEILQDKGYYVVAVETGLRALEVLTQVRARLLVMDLMLPDMPGDRVLERLRADETTKDVPVMVLSSHLHLLENGGYGPDQIMNKPFEISDVVGEVERLIGKPEIDEAPFDLSDVFSKRLSLNRGVA